MPIKQTGLLHTHCAVEQSCSFNFLPCDKNNETGSIALVVCAGSVSAFFSAHQIGLLALRRAKPTAAIGKIFKKSKLGLDKWKIRDLI